MTPQELIRMCHTLVGQADDRGSDADSLIGFFQMFRHDGQQLAALFDQLDQGAALHQRLQRLFAAAGDDRRPGGGRDVYFIVRDARPLEPSRAAEWARTWLDGLRQIALALHDQEIAEMLAPAPEIRVLEGIPPKHPKAKAEQSHLLLTLRQKVPAMIERIEAGPLPPALRPAYYFTACDHMLRDYLMWPFYRRVTGLDDPLNAYFELWRHGVKYRIFTESQVDVYLPRRG